jgi:hypothetical protein
LIVVDRMSVGQHPLMQDARNQNTTGLLTVENHVFAMLQTAQAGANLAAEPTECRIVRQHLATDFKLAKIMVGLGAAPCAKSVIGDAPEVDLSMA